MSFAQSRGGIDHCEDKVHQILRGDGIFLTKYNCSSILPVPMTGTPGCNDVIRAGESNCYILLAGIERRSFDGSVINPGSKISLLSQDHRCLKYCHRYVCLCAM